MNKSPHIDKHDNTYGMERHSALGMQKPSILIAGRDRNSVATLESQLCSSDEYQVETRVLMNGHADVLRDVPKLPSLLIICLTSAWHAELEAFAVRPPAARPLLLVVGSEGDLDMLRMAMQAGARDFLTEQVATPVLNEAVRRLLADAVQRDNEVSSRLNVVMNAKGGSGATLIACNIAHIMAASTGQKVALLDLDLQFGTLPLYLDLHPKHSLLDALESIDELDGVALEGFMMKHASGLHVLGTVPTKVVLSQEVSEEDLSTLLDLLKETYEQVVIDLPRQFDHLTVSVLERADRIAVVIQQDFATLRDGVRLLGMLRDDLGIPDERITVVLNRYRKGADVDLQAVRQALRNKSLVIIPNDYRNVSESVNIGSPLYENSRGSAVCKALCALNDKWNGGSRHEETGFLSRALYKLRGGVE